MGTSALDIDSSDLADWLDAKERRDRYWVVDEEQQLMERLSLPCLGEELAALVRRLPQRRLRVFGDLEAGTESAAESTDLVTELEKLARREGRDRVLELAWLSPDQSGGQPVPGERWWLATDVRSDEVWEEASREAAIEAAKQTGRQP